MESSNKKGGEMPRAFVLMPFADEFFPVYDQFIRPILTEVGFQVFRADDIRSQRNILQDILESIRDVDLIVADLTGGNENVYYELGLSHGLEKPVLLITQDIDDIPFDLQGYRHVQYSTHFAEIKTAQDRLRELSKGFLANEVKFGSPVSDFLHRSAPRYSGGTSDPAQKSKEQDDLETESERSDDRGYFDHLVDLQEGYGRLNEILSEVSDATTKINDLTNRTAADFEGVESAAHARKVARSLAKRVEEYSGRIAAANGQYSEEMAKVENSLEAVVAFLGSASEDPESESAGEIVEQLRAIEGMRDAAAGGREAFANLAETLRNVPKIERHLSRALHDAATEVEQFVSSIDTTISSADRALVVGQPILDL